MSSDSEDEAQLKQFLEAADTTLLTNDMFQRKLVGTGNENNSIAPTPLEDQKGVNSQELPKSQRYIEDDAVSSGTDFNLPKTMQNFLAKKLADVLKQAYEFDDPSPDTCSYKKQKNKRSRVKLLSGDEGYVNAYEDFEYVSKGPERKPDIKRRCVEKEIPMSEDERFKLTAIDGVCILSGSDTNSWAENKKRKNKIFLYTAGSNGVLHAKEDINEYTAERRKNKWNERKIKDFKCNSNSSTQVRKAVFG